MPTVNPRIKTIAVALACTFAGLSQAQTLKIGLASEPTAVDPHYHQTTPNEELVSHIFQPLVAMDADQTLPPALAKRSEERRGGQEGVRKWRSRWSPTQY